MRLPLAAVAAALLLCALPLEAPIARAEQGATAGQDVIVVLRRGQRPDLAIPGFERRLGIRPGLRYRHAFPGFAARVTAAQRAALERDPTVAYVADDRPISVAGQVVPVNVMRVGAPQTALAAIDGSDVPKDRVDADIAIVDTGIQRDHPDLNVVGGHNCINPDPTAWGDWYGHGTHVAGIAAALDDSTGVVGVAPGARLWSVRVFDAYGNGKLSWYACGVDWIAGERDRADPTRALIEVVNMSLRTVGRDDGNCGYTNGDPLHTAICGAVGVGITVVVAAGNDQTSASNWIPAGYGEVITVSALADFDGRPGGLGDALCYSWGGYDSDDTFADFSNFGPDVDLIAPGKCVYSTARESSYRVMSGTSMASPAVAGAAALWLSRHPGISPARVRAVLRAAATMRWFWRSDPDGVPDRLLDVSSFGHGPDVRLWLRSAFPYVGTDGGELRYTVDLARGDGYDGAIDLALIDAPSRVNGSFSNRDPSGLGGISSTLTLRVPALAAGAHEFTVSATVPGRPARTASASFRFDATDPWVTKPAEYLAASQVGQETVPVSLRWAAGDAHSGLRRLMLERSTDGGAWQADGTFASARRETLRWLADGHRYRFRIRAEDRVGNLSAWSIGSSFRLVRYEERSMSRSAGWFVDRTSAASGGSRYSTLEAGPTIRFTTAARQLAIVSAVGPGRGDASVSIDGSVRRVHLTRATAASRWIVDVRRWSGAATRSIVITALGDADHPRTDVDAVIVLR
jgi:subtilisin family serine protease